MNEDFYREFKPFVRIECKKCGLNVIGGKSIIKMYFRNRRSEKMMVSIKNCPHCNGEGILSANYSYKIRAWFVFVKCEICGSQGKITKSKENPEEIGWKNAACDGAVKAWNMRYKEDAEDYDDPTGYIL